MENDEIQIEGGETAEQGSEEQATYLRDLTEDEVYSRLQSAKDLPTTIRSLESRMFGHMGPLNERIQQLQKSAGQYSQFDPAALKKLEEYDPTLAKMLGEVLPQAFRLREFNPESLNSHLDPWKQEFSNSMNEQLVSAFYSREDLDAFFPPVKDGMFAPENQRQKDFIQWYSSQPYAVHQALSTLSGVPYIRAVRNFEKWESDLNAKRAKAQESKQSRLETGRGISSQGRAGQSQQKTEDELWEESVNSVLRSRKG